MMGVVVRHPACAMPIHVEAAAQQDESADTWGAWMARAQAGDRAAYHALLQAIGPYLRAIARRILGHEEVEDAVQEILLVVHGIRHTYEPGRPFKPWLATIASRRCIDLLRRRQREGLRMGEALDEEAHMDAEPGPAEQLERAQQDARMRGAVDRLSPGQRDAVRLLHLQELSLREAEARGGQSAGALKVASHRALKALRRALQGEHDHVP
jgi:RNA polymerase sigma factor (sigma-70 family)